MRFFFPRLFDLVFFVGCFVDEGRKDVREAFYVFFILFFEIGGVGFLMRAVLFDSVELYLSVRT